MSRLLTSLQLPLVSALPATAEMGQLVCLSTTGQVYKWQSNGRTTGWMPLTTKTDGSVDLPTETSASPASPTSGQTLFPRKRGFRRLAWETPDAAVRDAQTFMARQNCRWLRPNAGMPSLSSDGLLSNPSGTLTARSPTFSSLFAAAPRIGLVTAASAGAVAGVRHGAPIVALGTGAGQTAYGGFEFVCRFGLSSYAANMRAACGLFNTVAALSNQDVSANTNFVGIGKDAADTTWSIMSAGASGGATKIALGANFPANTSGVDLYELALFTPPGGTNVAYAVTRLNTGDYAEGVITSPLPAPTIGLAPQLWCCNNGLLVSVALDMVSMYLETDT